MIYVYLLNNGQQVMGDCNYQFDHLNKIDEAPYVTIENPMFIEKDEAGMKLRDCLMLSEGNKLTFRSNSIISFYAPTSEMREYYAKALTYAIRYTRPRAQHQIQAAVQDLEHAMQEEDEYANKLVNILMKAGGTTLQ